MTDSGSLSRNLESSNNVSDIFAATPGVSTSTSFLEAVSASISGLKPKVLTAKDNRKRHLISQLEPMIATGVLTGKRSTYDHITVDDELLLSYLGYLLSIKKDFC